MSGGAPRAPRDDLKNQRATLGRGGHWIGNPELKAPREKRKRPGETGVPGLQNKNLKDGEPAEKGRDGHIAPSVRETPCVRERTSPEATPVPPCQPQKPRPFSREKRGGEPEAPCRETSCSNRKVNFQESSPQANQVRKTPQGIAQVNDNTRQAAEADPTPDGGERQQGEKKKGQDPLLRRLEDHKHRTRQKRGL